MEFQEYKKYRWFFTKSGKLVIGGKSAIQNDELIKKLKATKKDFIVMHTVSPGSPFSILLSNKEDLEKSDISECAIFTGCFSRAWRSGAKKAEIHAFSLSSLSKTKSMAIGTWGVKNLLSKIIVPLELVLTKQSGVLRAVPSISIKNKKDILLTLVTGKTDKTALLPKIQIIFEEHLNQEELLSALPSGGIKISK